jgi:release factor glutamine methyltransferase
MNTPAAHATPAANAAAPTPSAAPWTVARLLNWTREHFEARGVDPPRLSAELLLAEALRCMKIELYTRFESAPTPDQIARFRELVKRAAAHEPIAYLLGRREFFSLTFQVTPDVLIPRPETETLVERAMAHAKQLRDEAIGILDLGTGSGCIAVCLAKFEPRARVVATDVSEAALAVAKDNVARHVCADRVRLLAADGLALPPDAVPPGGFHLIVSNPPYIAEAAVDSLPMNIRDYEPRVALAAGDGLAFYRRIAADGAALLRDAGRCYVEIGLGQAEAVAELFRQAGRFKHVGTYPDLAGLDRVLAFERL